MDSQSFKSLPLATWLQRAATCAGGRENHLHTLPPALPVNIKKLQIRVHKHYQTLAVCAQLSNNSVQCLMIYRLDKYKSVFCFLE